MILLPQIQCVHNQSVRFFAVLPGIRLATLMDSWAALCTKTFVFCFVLFLRCYVQSQHSKICCTSAAPWPCGSGASQSHRASWALFSCCFHNPCWASRPDLWISCAPYCRCLWVSASSLNCDILVWLVLDELTGLFFRTLGCRKDLREAMVPIGDGCYHCRQH